eukprot:CAMPEP_0194523780 /NCGR_PEP_ID=MMETSP0253-20130528/58771_1 /TAXON_ID=2966 /ORGANISM="Noctiluca scintillans" /LENGTH=43 /DNA_ID= /DNA_START= /DNA_END= /DNA_ORIENTATION=
MCNYHLAARSDCSARGGDGILSDIELREKSFQLERQSLADMVQ